MMIKIFTDHTLDRHQGLDEHVQKQVHDALDRFGEQIMSVEVHVSDAIAEKHAAGENRCMMEARVTGYKPIAVSDHSATLHQAIAGAADKLQRAVDSALGRLNDRKHNIAPKIMSAQKAAE
ncbi:MAG TPA: HPF/RaiA family ribosome-associated protein [Telluria sp.]|nr:HPF/RaiA family ribosome-associated protein [Telluria sp.]